MHKKGFDRERILLIALVAVAFFGFVLWSIQQIQLEQDSILSAGSSLGSLTKNRYIDVTSPKVNEKITSPLAISGQAILKSGSLKARLKDASGIILAETTLSSIVNKKMAEFSKTITFKKPTKTNGTLEIFEVLEKNGPETYKLSIPIKFAK